MPVKYTSHGKAIIQQQAVRGCTAAVAAMLIIDLKGKCDLHSLYATNLGNRESIEREFRKAQFEPQISFIKTMKELEKIVSVGSVMIDIVDPTLGNHEIVIDALDQTSVRLRDPGMAGQSQSKEQLLNKCFRSLRDYPGALVFKLRNNLKK